jgi:hypothetical protein
MRLRSLFIAGSAALVMVLAGTGPALASFGAIAYDQATGKFGIAWSESTQQVANDKALKDCGSKTCRAFPVPPGHCGALAVSNDAKESAAWGVSTSRTEKAAAELAAMQDCQKHTAGQCKVQGSDCNR